MFHDKKVICQKPDKDYMSVCNVVSFSRSTWVYTGAVTVDIFRSNRLVSKSRWQITFINHVFNMIESSLGFFSVYLKIIWYFLKISLGFGLFGGDFSIDIFCVIKTFSLQRIISIIFWLTSTVWRGFLGHIALHQCFFILSGISQCEEMYEQNLI